MKTVVDTRFTGVFGGTLDQVPAARHAVAVFLGDHPLAEEVKLIVTELASNALRHSGSAGGQFIVRAEIRNGCVWVEVQDAGGPWLPRQQDGVHGLDMVLALTGLDGWGVDSMNTGRVVWARIEQ